MTSFREIQQGRTGVEIAADEQGNSVGSVIVTKNNSTAKISYIGVKPGYQRGGVGSALLDKAIEWSRNNGCTSIKSPLIPVPGKEGAVVGLVKKKGGQIDAKGFAVIDLDKTD